MLRKRLLLAFAATVLLLAVAPAHAWKHPAGLPRIVSAFSEASPETSAAPLPVALPIVSLEAAADRASSPIPVAVSTVFRRPGLLNGIASGFLNAGLIGLVLGYGFFDELGGIASLVGLFLQFALIFVVVRLSWLWWQRRSAPETAGLTPRQLADEYVRPLPSRAWESYDVHAAHASLPPLKAADMASFERLLGEVKRAFGAKDLATLRAHVTADLFEVLATALSHHETGDLEGVSDVRLIESSLVGQWREDTTDYARLTMRFSLAEHVREPVGGSGGVATETRRVEAAETWTFKRPASGEWLVSAIQ
jgi:predicted lipid-binding transport protein (Tim44 family)